MAIATAGFRWMSLAAFVLLAACTEGGTGGIVPPPPAGQQAAAPVPQASPWSLPAPHGAAQPDLVASADGRLLLSWIEPGDPVRHRLRLASVRAVQADAWAPALTIAEGDDWFVNWADSPHVYALPDGSLWAHWLRRSGPSPMDYGIVLVRSSDGGHNWSAPQPVHPAGTRGAHGFVSFWTQAPDRLGIAWLDSRQKAAAGALDDAHDGHHGGGAAMMLRAAVHGPDGVQQAEWSLDDSTCDCCTTAAAMTARGAVVVYRGRSAQEIRDTRIVRFSDGAWTAPQDVYADGWHFPGCPVNGPVVAADGAEAVWTAWYTEADGVPELRAAYSGDAGDRFGAPATLAKGPHVLGRLAMAHAGEHLLAAWLEETPAGTQRLVLGRYDLAWGRAERIEVAELAARGRASGLPRLAWAQGAAWLVWTDVVDGKPMLRGAVVR